MQTAWDYSKLAKFYVKRPPYSDEGIDQMLREAGIVRGDRVADIGAGTGILTKMLADRGLKVDAVEPNDAMRHEGEQFLSGYQVKWSVGTGEATGLRDGQYNLVTFGSSFNTTDSSSALKESVRILKSRGWFACMWNHRDLEDPIQRGVEEIIKANVPGYDYGKRREDQTDIINKSGLFGAVRFIEGSHLAEISVDDYMDAWRSHATLERQAKDRFPQVIQKIEVFLGRHSVLNVPYTTRIWLAQRL